MTGFLGMCASDCEHSGTITFHWQSEIRTAMEKPKTVS